jgi:uncharacterized membrane protein HdeD (DUF308 family)
MHITQPVPESLNPPPTTTRTGIDSVLWPVTLSIVGNVGGLVGFLLPGNEQIPVAAQLLGVLFAALSIPAAWGLWNHRRWGSRATIAISAVNLLMGLPALTDPPSSAIATAIVIGAAIGIAIIVLLSRKALRRQLQ